MSVGPRWRPKPELTRHSRSIPAGHRKVHGTEKGARLGALSKSKMAAARRVLSLIAKVEKNGRYFQRIPARIALNANKRLSSSSKAVYLPADGIESNPFYEKYAERIKVVRNEIKEGRL